MTRPALTTHRPPVPLAGDRRAPAFFGSQVSPPEAPEATAMTSARPPRPHAGTDRTKDQGCAP